MRDGIKEKGCRRTDKEEDGVEAGGMKKEGVEEDGQRG